MVVADADESLVFPQVIDAVGDGLPLGPAREVVVQDLRRLPSAGPFPAAAGEVPDELLLLGVHADHGLPGGGEPGGALADVAELRVPVRVRGALRQGLVVGLQPPSGLVHQPPDHRRRRLAPLIAQFIRQFHQGFRCPPQARGHRVAGLPVVIAEQGVKGRGQFRVLVLGLLPPAARAPDPALFRVFAQVGGPAADGLDRRAGRLRHELDPAVAQLPRLGAQPDPAGPLVQVRRRIRPLARDLGLALLPLKPRHGPQAHAHSGTLDQNPKNTKLFKSLPLACIPRTFPSMTSSSSGSPDSSSAHSGTAPGFPGASSGITAPPCYLSLLTGTLPPFPMHAAFPRSEYYGGSAPPAPSAGIAPIPSLPLAGTGHGSGHGRFPRSLLSDQRVRHPALPLRHRHGYPAALSPWPPIPGS